MLLTEGYESVIQDLFHRKPVAEKNLSRMHSLLAEWENPHQAYPCIHVAGTNGKGGVTAKIAHALQKAGYRVGRYTSPHLYEYTERISINDVFIPKEIIVEYYHALHLLMEKRNLYPNFFEATTLFAFRYFKEQKVDIAVLETGLGGKLDSTNVITPLISIITSIGEDHLEKLGNTLEEIAAQKAGIIKAHVPVVVGPTAKYAPILQRAKNLSSPIHFIQTTSGFYDIENQMIAKRALHILQQDFQISDRNIEDGLKYCLPCRFEKRDNVIYDVAHNPDGFQKLAEALSYFYPGRTFRFLMGMSGAKNYRACLAKIQSHAHYIHFVASPREGSVPASLLAASFREISSCPCSVENSISEGFARAQALDSGLLIVCGSFYIMAEARRAE